MRRRLGVWAGLVAVGVVLAGCGTHVATRAQVITRADAICASTLRAVRAGGASGRVATVVPLIAREVHQLDALPHPTEDHAVLAQYLAAMAQALTQWRSLATAQRAGSTARASTALAALGANRAPVLAARYGMRDCAAAGATVGSGARTASG